MSRTKAMVVETDEALLEQIEFSIQGLTGTILHNGRLSNPIDPIAKQMKAITSKRAKTEKDYEALADLEWMGSLYTDEEDRPCWPGYCLEGAMVEAAAKIRLKKPAQGGIFVLEDAPILFKGPTDLEELKKDARFRHVSGVKVMASRVWRTRPIFLNWKLDFRVAYDTELLNESQVRQIVAILGQKVGLSDFRPKFGRFKVIEANALGPIPLDALSSD